MLLSNVMYYTGKLAFTMYQLPTYLLIEQEHVGCTKVFRYESLYHPTESLNKCNIYSSAYLNEASRSSHVINEGLLLAQIPNVFLQAVSKIKEDVIHGGAERPRRPQTERCIQIRPPPHRLRQ
mmetsp:Transcript_8023/g.17441  ORF Transcript_8023/g.17441 Transcript_8023/m.17441 type:complete len:123 (-) Transcript_8023:1054-1422(-)